MNDQIAAVASPLYWLGFTAGTLCTTVVAFAFSVPRIVTRRRQRQLRATATESLRILGGLRHEKPRDITQIRRDRSAPAADQAETPVIGGGLVAGRAGRHAQPGYPLLRRLRWQAAGAWWVVVHPWSAAYARLIDDLWVGMAGNPTAQYRPKRHYV